MVVESTSHFGESQVLTLAEYRGAPRPYQTTQLLQRGLQLPDVRRIYNELGIWREVSVGIVGNTKSTLQAKFADDLIRVFTEQGHTTFVPSQDGKLNAPRSINILLAHMDLPADSRPLVERIPDSNKFVGLEILRTFGVRKSPGHLVGIVTIPERLSEVPHEEAVFITRRLFFRMGVPSAVIITQDGNGELIEFTLATPEGGHISIPANDYERALIELRDSLVTLEVAEELPTTDNRSTPFPLEEFEHSPFPRIMIETGNRLDHLGYLRAPIQAKAHTDNRFKLGALSRFLGSQEWAEAAWLVVDPEGSLIPDVGTIYMSATGADGSDKRHLTEQDVVPVGDEIDGLLQVCPVPGKNTRKKSVEAVELSSLVRNSPKTRLRKINGLYIPESDGEYTSSVWAAFLHLHVNYDRYDPSLVESLYPNIGLLPYGVGCGTNLMKVMSQDNAKRAEEIMQRRKPSMFIWSVNRHGIIGAVPWGMPIEGRDGKYHQGLEAALELIDPDSYGAVRIDPHDIPQFPQGKWPHS